MSPTPCITNPMSLSWSTGSWVVVIAFPPLCLPALLCPATETTLPARGRAVFGESTEESPAAVRISASVSTEVETLGSGNEASFGRPDRELGAGIEPKLAKGIGDVRLHGPFTKH